MAKIRNRDTAYVPFACRRRRLRPACGHKMPGLHLQDQDGKSHTLKSLLGPKGAVIVFFRSADW